MSIWWKRKRVEVERKKVDLWMSQTAMKQRGGRRGKTCEGVYVTFVRAGELTGGDMVAFRDWYKVGTAYEEDVCSG